MSKIRPSTQLIVPGDATKYLDGTGAFTTPAGGGGGGTTSLLASKFYGTATETAYSTTSTTFVDVDATNLAVTFTAPASGTVLVDLAAYMDVNAQTTATIGWCLRSGSTDVSGTHCQVFRADLDNWDRVMLRLRVTGLTSGTSYTYKWGWAVTFGSITTRLFAGDGQTSLTQRGPASMVVWSA